MCKIGVVGVKCWTCNRSCCVQTLRKNDVTETASESIDQDYRRIFNFIYHLFSSK